MQRTFETPRPLELYVENNSGRVDVTATTTDQTSVTVTGRDAEEFVVEQRDGQVVVLAPRRGPGFLTRDHRAEVVVALPTGSRLTTKTGSADVAAHGVLGDVWVNTGSGQVTLEEVDGTTHVQTGSGDVGATELRLPARVKTGSGDTRVERARGSLSVVSGSGDVRVTQSVGPLAIKTGSGDVLVGECADDLSFSTGSGDLQVDRARRGRFTVKGASGDIHLGIPAGTPVWTDINTVTGRISSDLAATGEPAEGQDHVELRAKTASGDITLQQH